jgi:hypothetical protein
VNLSDFTPLDQRRYVVRHASGDFLRAVKRTPWQTVRWEFQWSPDRAEAMEFNWSELVERGPEALSAKEQDKSLLMNLTCGYGRSVKMVRIK